MDANEIGNSIIEHLLNLDNENEISPESLVKAVTMIAAKTMEKFDVTEVEGGGVKLILIKAE